MNATVSSFFINPSLLKELNQSSKIARASVVSSPFLRVRGAFSILSRFFFVANRSSLYLNSRSPRVFPFSLSLISSLVEIQVILTSSAGTFASTPIMFLKSKIVVLE
jgi:hypothetical protein